jgi:hypothetical protein
MRKTDETGLCARDCGCPQCEVGNRPTERDRLIARRALALRMARQERKDARSNRARLKAQHHAALAAATAKLADDIARDVPPWTEEERQEAAAMRAAFRR